MQRSNFDWSSFDWSQSFRLTERPVPQPTFLEGVQLSHNNTIRWRILNQETVFIGGPIRFWPPEIQMLAIQEHLNNLQRLKLILFYRFNGLSPSMTHQHMLYGGRIFDAEATRHIAYVIEHAYTYNYLYYDMLLGSYTRNISLD